MFVHVFWPCQYATSRYVVNIFVHACDVFVVNEITCMPIRSSSVCLKQRSFYGPASNPSDPVPAYFPSHPSRAPEDCTLTSVAKRGNTPQNPQSYDGRWLMLLDQCCMIAMIIISYSSWMDKTPQFVCQSQCSMTLGSLAGAQ